MGHWNHRYNYHWNYWDRNYRNHWYYNFRYYRHDNYWYDNNRNHWYYNNRNDRHRNHNCGNNYYCSCNNHCLNFYMSHIKDKCPFGKLTQYRPKDKILRREKNP